jgi:hypothetical protein
MVHIEMSEWYLQCCHTAVGEASAAATTLVSVDAGVMVAEPHQNAPAVLQAAIAGRVHVSLGATDWPLAAKARAWACVCLHSIVPSVSSYNRRLA